MFMLFDNIPFVCIIIEFIDLNANTFNISVYCCLYLKEFKYRALTPIKQCNRFTKALPIPPFTEWNFFFSTSLSLALFSDTTRWHGNIVTFFLELYFS